MVSASGGGGAANARRAAANTWGWKTCSRPWRALGSRYARDRHEEVTMWLSTLRIIASLVLAFLLVPRAAQAQPLVKMPRIGYLTLRALAAEDEAFKHGLRDLGWIEGQNIAIEYRSAAGQVERLPALAAELVRLQVDCLVTRSTAVVQAAKDATSSIPIVMVLAADPIETGLVASLARPGGNITGMSSSSPELAGKRLEQLRDVLPTL